MRFTIRNVMSILQEFRGHPYIPSDLEKTYRWASLLPDDIQEMDPEILYVCRLTDAMLRNQLEPNCHFVCVADRYLNDDDLDSKELLKNLIILEENRSVSWLLNLIQNRFRELEQWERDLKDCVQTGGSYQDIFDFSEKFLKNSLFALDGAYRLIAYSKTYKSTDPINISLYEKGYYTPEILEKFYSNRRLSVYSNTPGMTINKPGVISQFESISQWCRFDGMELLQIVEVFSHSPSGPDSKELFGMLMHYVNICFQREQKESGQSVFKYTRLMKDILYNGLTDTIQINEAAKKIGIPVTGHFDVYCISFNDIDRVLIGRFISQILDSLPDARVITNQYNITVLNYYRTGDVEHNTTDNLKKIHPLLEKHRALCGVSLEFAAFSELTQAVRQAQYAISLSRNSPGALEDLNNKEKEIIHYKDVLLFHVIDSASMAQFDAFYNNPYTICLNRLIEYDSKYGTSLYDILFSYLCNERRATETGNELHMHRNTVMYHIGRITEMIDVDLDDYFTRQGLLISYHFKKIKNN